MNERTPRSPEVLTHKISFLERLEEQWAQGNFVCVGLDPDITKIPSHLREASPRMTLFNFNREIIDATADYVCAYKPNSAYYEALGTEGMKALALTVQHIKGHYPEIPVILDAKRGDIGQSNSAYGVAAFDLLGADAITVHPYFGREALQPLLDRKDKGIIIMGANSNPGSGEFQDLLVDGDPLYRVIARKVANEWNQFGNCSLTVGATEPEKIVQVRSVAPNLPLLVLGIGAQGGDLGEAVHSAKDNRNRGIIINSSRSIIYASGGEDFADAAKDEVIKMTNQIRLTVKVN